MKVFVSALRTAAIVVGLLAIPGGTPASAQLAQFVGNWTGTGTITVRDGTRERLRCRGRFTGGAQELAMGLRCASDSYTFELQSDIKAVGSEISGTWNETTRQVYGQLTGRAVGGRIEASAVAAGFTAAIVLHARGNNQQVSIRAPGSEISDVSVSLARGGR